MHRRRLIDLGILCLMVVVIMLVGCAPQVRSAPNPLEIQPAQYGPLFDAAIVELRSHGFTVDRQDYRLGTITTKPFNSPTLFEPWFAMNTTSDQAVDSTLNHQRRQVAITFEPVEAPDQLTDLYQMRAEVMVERLALPVVRLTGSTSRHRLMVALRDVPAEWKPRRITKYYWRPMQRDPYLEQRLIHAIVQRSTTAAVDNDATE